MLLIRHTMDGVRLWSKVTIFGSEPMEKSQRKGSLNSFQMTSPDLSLSLILNPFCIFTLMFHSGYSQLRGRLLRTKVDQPQPKLRLVPVLGIPEPSR